MSKYAIIKTPIGTKDGELVTALHYPRLEALGINPKGEGTLMARTFGKLYLASIEADRLGSEDQNHKYKAARIDKIPEAISSRWFSEGYIAEIMFSGRRFRRGGW